MDDAVRYAERLYPADPVLEQVKQAIRERGMPEISVPFAYGRLLTLLVAASGAKQVLEIGALGGYSGICLARGLPEGGRLTSLELDPAYAELAGLQLDKAGFGGRVGYLVGDAQASLRQLAEEGRKFDFFFIDADKGNYPIYLDACLEIANPGAILAADNAFMNGRSFQPEAHPQSPSVQAMKQFNERIASDPRLDSTILPAYDGLALARVKG